MRRPWEGGSPPWLPPPKATQALPRDCRCWVGARAGWALPALLDSALCVQVPPGNVHLGAPLHTQVTMRAELSRLPTPPSPRGPATQAGSVHVALDFVLIYPTPPHALLARSVLCPVTVSQYLCLLQRAPGQHPALQPQSLLFSVSGGSGSGWRLVNTRLDKLNLDVVGRITWGNRPCVQTGVKS